MDDSGKHASSYQVDQEILEARGISMTVEEVAGLPTCKYSERVQSLKLRDEDLAFLKGLRRRIKNRLASQNSRRRSVEHLRRLTRELRAVRACRNDALAERRALVERRDTVRDKCARLRQHLVQILQSRADTTNVPSIDVELPSPKNFIKNPPPIRPKVTKETKIKIEPEIIEDDVYERVRQELQKEMVSKEKPNLNLNNINKDINVFECKIGKLVQQSVNHIFNEKKVFAKTVFLSNEDLSTEVKCFVDSSEEVLNLCVKEGKRKSHGRKQTAPRRIAYCSFNDANDGVLDLKIKK